MILRQVGKHKMNPEHSEVPECKKVPKRKKKAGTWQMSTSAAMSSNKIMCY